MPSRVTTTGAVDDCLASKNDFDCSIGGVMGVAGEEMSMEESSVFWLLRNALSIVLEKSESLPELTDSADDADDEAEMDRMSGAFNAWTFVVDINSVGRDIMFLRMEPVAYRTVPFRVGEEGSSRFMRFVKALARDIVAVLEFEW